MAAVMPSTGLLLLNAFQLLSLETIARRRAGVSGIHLPRYCENMYSPISFMI